MKKHLILSACLIMAISSFAQKKDFSYKFYGQIRTDLYYNSRANEETVDGLFYMYPKDEVFDSNGRDLNATANGSFYTLYTRLGLDVKGPKLGRAMTSAKVEADFRGITSDPESFGRSTFPTVQPCSANSLPLYTQRVPTDGSSYLAITVSVTRYCR